MPTRTTKVPKEWGKKIISYHRFLQAQAEARERASATRAQARAGRVSPDSDRAEKIRQVRERIKEGFYDRPEVLEEIAARMIALLPELEPAEEAPRES